MQRRFSNSRIFNARQPKDRRKHYSFTEIILMLNEAIHYLEINRSSFDPGDFIFVLGVSPQAISVLAEDMEDINPRIAGELHDLGSQLNEIVIDLRSGESDIDYLLDNLSAIVKILSGLRKYLTSSRSRSSRTRRLSSSTEGNVSLIEFCDYWELERDQCGILMDELDTNDADELFPWETMLMAMNRAKDTRTEDWYGSYTDYWDSEGY